MKIVIVGNGIAGNEVAFSLRRRDPDVRIVILSAEDVPEYDPCSLPYYLGGECAHGDLFRKNPSDYADHQIELMYHRKVMAIDPKALTVTTTAGEAIGYDRLVLAHGGDLFIPPIPGIGAAGVFSCKQLRETEKLHDHTGSRAVVIGSGAIGIEAAEGLKRKGYEVHIIELMGWILPAMFDEPVSRRLATAMEGYGIRVRTGEKVLEILTTDNRVSGVRTDQQTLACDTVVVATGVVPGAALARTAGIAVGRGIQVDRYMETSVPGIYACGDCVESVDACTGEIAMFQLKHNALDQARIVARNLAGERARYLGAYAFARAHFFSTHAVSFGKTHRGTECILGRIEVLERESGGDYLRVILRDNQIIGGQAIGAYADGAGLLLGAMWRRDDIGRLRSRMKQIPPGGAAPYWPMLRLGNLLGFGKDQPPARKVTT